MSENRGSLLPVYVLADESGSMTKHLGELNQGLQSLHGTLLGEPMAAAKVRFTVLGFSDDVVTRVELADLRRENQLPELATRGPPATRRCSPRCWTGCRTTSAG